MKLVKFDDEYYLLEESIISSGDYLYNNNAIIKIIRAVDIRKGLLVIATTDSLIDELPTLDASVMDSEELTSVWENVEIEINEEENKIIIKNLN